MSFVRTSLLVAALALTACVKQGPVHEPRNSGSPQPEWFQLCNDPRFNSICKPASANDPTQPIQIDTNLTFPATHLFSAELG
jgi:hypothetical protein